MAVVVAYERRLDRIEAWPKLQEWLRADHKSMMTLEQVLIYDNSPRPLAKPESPIPSCLYRHDASNGGTAAAYCLAIEIAAESQIEWLLLLDHDTHLPDCFLNGAWLALRRCESGKPAALLPWVNHEGAFISPARVTSFGSIRPLRRDEAIQPGSRLTAIASGSLLRVTALRTLLPLPAELWLDYVDHWIFSALRAQGVPMLVFDEVIQHDLSIATLASVSPRRLLSMLDGEAHFHDTLGYWARIAYPLRLIARMVRMLWISPPLARHTLRWALKRLSLAKT